MSASRAPDVEPAPGPGVEPVRLARLRWRCRRGMLENDLLLTRFLDARGSALTDAELGGLDALLDLPDNDLWDLLAGRTVPADPALVPLVAALASTCDDSFQRPRGSLP